MNRTLRLERMEDRVVPAVVSHFSPSTGVLRVTGSDASERVHFEGTGSPGQVDFHVEGTDGDAVYFGVRSIRVRMGGGDDSVLMGGIAVSGSVRVTAGTGSDYIRLDTAGDLFGWGAYPVYIGGSLGVELGGQGGDSFVWSAGRGLGGTVAGDLTVSGAMSVYLDGQGTGYILEPADLTVGGELAFRHIGTQESVIFFLSDVNIYGNTRVSGSTGWDLVTFHGCNFAGRVKVDLGLRDDTLSMRGYNRFSAAVVVDFGRDRDTLSRDLSGSSTFWIPMRTLGGPEVISYI